MSLADTQRLIARLATDTELHKKFVENPIDVGAGFGVQAGEACALALETAALLEPFARSLVGKRLNEVRKLLPRTSATMGGRFGSLFRSFAPSFVPQGVKKHVLDAIAFAEYLEAKLKEEDRSLAWIGSLARFEASWLTVRSRPCLLIRRFYGLRFEVNQKAPRWTFALWLRLPRRHTITYYRFTIR